MKTTSVCLREAQVDAIDELTGETKRTPEVPEMSKSDVIRHLIDKGLEECEDLRELLSEGTIVHYREEQYAGKGGDGWLRNQRTGFETQVKRFFDQRFENGYTPQQLEEAAENMHQKAEHYWPRDTPTDYSERRQEAHEYVEKVKEATKEASNDSDYDPLEPDYSEYGGVEDGQSKQSLDREAVIEDIKRRMQAGASDPDALVTAVSNEWGISENVALDLFREAKQQSIGQRQNGHRESYTASGGRR